MRVGVSRLRRSRQPEGRAADSSIRCRRTTARNAPSTPLPIRYCCFVIDSPACSIRALRLVRCLPFFSISRRPSAICFLRAVLSTRADAPNAFASVLATAARRLSARESPPTKANASPPNPIAKHPATIIGLTMTNHLCSILRSERRFHRAATHARTRSAPMTILRPACDFRHVQGCGQTLFFPVHSRALPEPRPADPRRPVAPYQFALSVFAEDFIHE